MSVAATPSAHKSSLRIPLLTPLYGAHLESFCAQAEGTYRCGSGAASEFCLAYSGAEATHCSFIHKSGTFSVKRIDGRVWVNDVPVRSINRLIEGDVVSLGPVSYRLEYQSAPSYLPGVDDRHLISFQAAGAVAPRPFDDLNTAALPIPEVIAAPSAPDTCVQSALLQELQEEHGRQLAELRLLREEVMAAQADLLNQESLQHARESEFRLRCKEYASREISLNQSALELLVKTEALALQESELSDRAEALADAEQAFAVHASVETDLRCTEHMAAIEAKRDELDRREAEIVEREVLSCILQELQKELQDARQQVEDISRLRSESALLEQRLQQADLSIEELGKSLLLSESNVRRANEERELELRAELLDRRDEELLERTRRIERTESDFESQRRQLLEARQQLEQARVEILSASRKYPETSQHDSHLSYVAATHLRSERSGPFGQQKPTSETFTPPLPSVEFVDLPEPAGDIPTAVFHFGSDAALLAAPEPTPTVNGDAEAARDICSHDVLRDYMEQLLSRYRKSAGTVLPRELNAADHEMAPTATSSVKTSEGLKPGSPPKVKSYIEQYLAGNMGDLESNEPLTMSEPDIEMRPVAALEEPRPVHLSPKMDLLKLKENMDSFRTLSTLSVESALASHAIKVERVGFTGRMVIAVLLTMMTLLLGIANAWGATDAPMLKWVTLISAIAIWSELYGRYTRRGQI